VDAYHKLEDDRKTLIFVGDGELRQSLGNYVDEIGVESVRFFGFQNRDQIARYYAISDWIVLPSIRETWGIVVNEAMCFGLPVIVSHQVGAGIDLVSHGWNGYHVGIDDDALAMCMKEIAGLPEADRWQMGVRSLDTMKAWSDRDLAESLVRNIEYTRGQRPGPEDQESV
jgi:glycosyltransferase involved in cell wall biosynthesis